MSTGVQGSWEQECGAAAAAAAAAKSLQLCPTLCDSIDGSPPGSSIHGILQPRILEWVTISFFMERGDWRAILGKDCC